MPKRLELVGGEPRRLCSRGGRQTFSGQAFEQAEMIYARPSNLPADVPVRLFEFAQFFFRSGSITVTGEASAPLASESEVTTTVAPGRTMPAIARRKPSDAWKRCHS